MTRRWRWLAALAGLALCGALGWQLLTRAPSASSADSPRPVVPNRAAATTLAVVAVPARSPAPAAAVAAQLLPSKAAPAPAASAAAAAWDICGVGTVPLPPAQAASSPAELPPPLHLFAQAGMEDARERVLAAMDRGDPFARTTAILMRAVDDQNANHGQVIAALNAAALNSGDPAALALAARRCSRDCNPAVADAWVRAEPDNAAAWLSLMHQQPGRRDEAVAALAHVQTHRLRWGTMAGAVLNAIAADVPPLAQLWLLSDASGIDAASILPPMQPVLTLCQPSPALDAAATAACAALAQAMAEHSDTLLGCAHRSAVGGLGGLAQGAAGHHAGRAGPVAARAGCHAGCVAAFVVRVAANGTRPGCRSGRRWRDGCCGPAQRSGGVSPACRPLIAPYRATRKRAARGRPG